ncbi:Adenine nucleotide alpha hydrolases-like protein [Dioscorea alata]|uniref:Adenine nucleotide alpha hydrolases-like protein n=1 Tax=Dioscorea alata TaxID=55571 RepID=A0ACB7V7Y6_DIOAL|nr:Adenine nucleotide alpha hydrolases-like protein [Dioscorea alata]
MAIVSSSVALHLRQPQMERRLVRSLEESPSSRSVGSGGGGTEDEMGVAPVRREEENEAPEKVFVAVGKDFKDGKTLISWVCQNTPKEKKIVLVHVHRPAQMIPMMGSKFPASQLAEQQVKAYRQVEKQKMNKGLDEYLLFCSQLKFQAEKLVIETDDVAKGLIEVISQHRITNLVMGAAADKQYSKKMKAPKSKTAINVQQQADQSCKIWFVCKGNLICTRDADLDGYGTQQPAMVSPSSSSGHSEDLRSKSLPGHTEASNWLPNIALELFKNKSASNRFESPGDRTLNPKRRLSSQGSAVDLWDEVPQTPQAPSHSPMTEEILISNSGPLPIPNDEESEVGSVTLPSLHESDEDAHFSSPQHELEEAGLDDEVYQSLQHALTEVENSKQEAYEEARRRQKAEREAMEAMRKAKASEYLFVKEMKQRKEIEETLAREKLELEKLKIQNDRVSEKLGKALEQKQALEACISNSHLIVKDFEEKLSTAQSELNWLQKEHEDLQRERDNANREIEELRQRKEVGSSVYRPLNFLEFSYSELQQATQNFDKSMKIGEGGYGTVYRGFLRHTAVAIKLLSPQSKQGEAEFQQEVASFSFYHFFYCYLHLWS